MRKMFLTMTAFLGQCVHCVISSVHDWLFVLTPRPSYLAEKDFADFAVPSDAFPGGIYNPGALKTEEGTIAVMRGEKYRPFWLYIDSRNSIGTCTPLFTRFAADTLAASAPVALDRQSLPGQQDRRYEDFRLFTFRQKHYSNLCVFIPHMDGSRWSTAVDPQNRNRQVLAQLDARNDRLDYLGEVQVDFPMSNREKNFLYFESDGELYLLYSICPYVLLKADNWPALTFTTVVRKDIALPFHESHHRRIHLSVNPIPFDDRHMLTVISRKARGYGLISNRFVNWAILIDRTTLLPVKISARCLSSRLDVYLSSVVLMGDELLFFGGRDDRSSCVARMKKETLEFVDL